MENMEISTPCKYLSMGWLLEEGEEQIVIAGHFNDIGLDDQVMGVMVIPSCSILKKTLLKVS